MSMDSSRKNIVDLPDEVLVTIFKKLANTDILYSLIGVNQKLEKVACDITFTKTIDLIKTLSNKSMNSKVNAILDRFCFQVLPRIHEDVECFAVQGSIFQRILQASSYPNLHKLILDQMNLISICQIFNGTLLDLRMLKK